MDQELIQKIIATLKAEGATQLDGFEYSPSEREMAEAGEAANLRTRWLNTAPPPLRELLEGDDGVSLVLHASGALRTFIESLLLDAEQRHAITLRIERQSDHDPYIEVPHVGRNSPLGKVHGYITGDDTNVHVQAPGVAFHLASRLGLEFDRGLELWRCAYESFRRGDSVDHLFAGLHFNVSAEGAIEVRLVRDDD